MTGFKMQLVSEYEGKYWRYFPFIEGEIIKSEGHLRLKSGLDLNYAVMQFLDVAQIDELIKHLQVAKDELKQLPMTKSKEDDSDCSSSCEDSEVDDTDDDETIEVESDEKDSSITMTPAGTNKQITISFKGFGI